MINVQVDKTGSENALNVLRKFTKRVQGSGVLNRVRGLRYYERTLSHFKKKRNTLTRISRKAEMERMAKLGKGPVLKQRS
jgi:ribosomal protein S21